MYKPISPGRPYLYIPATYIGYETLEALYGTTAETIAYYINKDVGRLKVSFQLKNYLKVSSLSDLEDKRCFCKNQLKRAVEKNNFVQEN